MLSGDDAAKIVDEITKFMKNTWSKIAPQSGILEKDWETISSAFVFPGFFVY
jgi:hypothetical protein